MKYLVTGGAGFIGSECTCQLVRAGHQVVVVDDLSNGKKSNLQDLPEGTYELVVEDIRKTEQILPLLKQVDAIFHLACLGVRHSLHSPLPNHEVNATATLNLLIAARNAGIKRFVYVSSSEIYGTARWVPMTEDYPPSPMTVYGASKLAGECYARAFHRTYNYGTVMLRPFNAYGPRSHHEGDSGEVIPKFLLRALANRDLIIFGDGTQTRDFTEVSDTARGIILAGQTEGIEGETFNLGSGFEITINELAQEVRSLLGKDIKIRHDSPRPGDVLRLYAETSRAQKLLGFTPTVKLRDGLQKLLQWYQNLPQTPDQLLRDEVDRNWELQK